MGRPRKLTAEQQNEAWSLHLEGHNYAQIARQLGVSYQLIRLSILRDQKDLSGTPEEAKPAIESI